MFPRTLRSALHDYLDTEMGWARHGIVDGPADADVGGSEAARLTLLGELDAPYPASGEPLVTAVREFMQARMLFEHCAELDVGLSEAAERLDEARCDLIAEIRAFDRDNTVASPKFPHHVVLVAVADDDQAEDAVRVAGELATKLAAGVVVLHVVGPALRLGRDPLAIYRRQQASRRDGVELLARAEGCLPAGLPTRRMLREGVAAAQIVAAARALDAKFVVLGTRSRGRMARFLLGSTSQAVSRDSGCPVVIVGHDGPVGDLAQTRVPPTHLLAAC